MAKQYELTYTIQENILPEEASGLLEKITSYLPSPPVKQEAGQSLFSLEFYSEPGAIEGLDKNLKSESKIKRYLILKKETAKAIKIRTRKTPAAPLETPQDEQKVEKTELKEIDKKLKEIFGE